MWRIWKKVGLQEISSKRDLYSKKIMSLMAILVTSRLEWIMSINPPAFVMLNSRLALPQYYPSDTNALPCLKLHSNLCTIYVKQMKDPFLPSFSHTCTTSQFNCTSSISYVAKQEKLNSFVCQNNPLPLPPLSSSQPSLIWRLFSMFLRIPLF